MSVTASKHRRCQQTYRAIIFDPLRSFNGMIQAGPAQVDILAVVVGREQLQQTRQDHIVIVIHVTKPPEEGQTKRINYYEYEKYIDFTLLPDQLH